MGDDLRVLMLETSGDAEPIAEELRKAGVRFAACRVELREDFVRALTDFAPDIVLSNCRLPAFDGLSALAICREVAPEVPFVFVSEAVGEECAINMLHEGAADYVPKDRLSRLGPAIRRVLENARRRELYRRAEIELAESEEKFRLMADLAQDAIAIIDDEGKVVYWNRAATRTFGYAAEEIAGRVLHDVLAPTRHADACRNRWREFRETGAGAYVGRTVEVSALRRDGTEFPVEVSISAVLLQGRWHGIGVVRDMSERNIAADTLRRSNRFLRTLSRCNEALVQADDEDRLLHTMCRIVVEVGGFALAWVAYPQSDPPGKLEPKAAFGDNAARFLDGLGTTEGEAGTGESPFGRAMRSATIQVIHDTADTAVDFPCRPWAFECGYRSAVSLPLITSGETLGALNIFSAETGSFNEGEIDILNELASDLAFGIATLRARKREADSARKLAKSLEDTIRAMATTIEARDPYTAGHHLRVGRLAHAIALEMGLPEEQVVGIQRGAEIHDLGKIHIPAEILNRPGRIGELERQIIQTHPQVGHAIVRDIDFPWPIATMILQHHERLDGSGYPNRLAGDQIILEARVIAVADVCEAMMSHRPYRPGRGVEAAIEELQRGSGTLFDPQAVAACVALLRSGQFTPESFSPEQDCPWGVA